ncbi:MAG: AraC family transcriptional regulator [Sphingomicrobium sp.]
METHAHMPMNARAWSDSLSSPPDLCSAQLGWNGGLVRRWLGTSPTMVQPQLDQHYVVLHLAGAKRVRRSLARRSKTVDVSEGSLSIVPARSEWNWRTQGPIGFAHLYVPPRFLDRIVQEDFDRDPSSVALGETIGHVSPSLRHLFESLLDEVLAPSFGRRLMLDSLFHAFSMRLLSECSSLSLPGRTATHRIAPFRLCRVIDFVQANLAGDLALQDLADVAGASRFHFARAFREATGLPPYRYVVQRRVEAAKALLIGSDLPLADVADRTGFRSAAQLTVMFKRAFGATPSQFRRQR